MNMLCKCGCGEETNDGRQYIRYHNVRNNNPMHSKVIRDRVSKTVKNMHLSGYYKECGYAEKISATLKTLGMSDIKKKHYQDHPETKQKIGAKTREYMNNPEIKEQHRASIKKAYAEGRLVSPFKFLDQNGSNNPMFGKECPHAKGECYNGIYMRSTWEVKIAEMFDAENIVWQYEPHRFTFEHFSYTPDFYLPDYDLYIEVKGWIGRNLKDADRIKAFEEEHKLLLIDGEKYESLIAGSRIFDFIQVIENVQA